ALTVSATAKKVSKIASIPEGFTVQNSNKETLNKDSEVLEGDELTITPNVTAPDKLNRVVINGTAYGAKESYSFTVGTADVEIKAEIAKPTAIEVVGLKDEYFVGVSQAEAIAGLELNVTYDDGSSEYHVAVTGEMLGDSFSTADDKMSFTITYGTATKSVSVDLTAVAVEKIAVTSDLTKREYKVGEELSLEGGKITVYNNDGTSTVVDMSDASVSVTGYDTATEPNSDLKLTITYTNNGVDYTTEYSIVVVAADAKEVSGISISTQPTKTAYFVGDELSVDGKITVTYSDDSSSEIAITPAMVTGFNSSAAAETQTLTVTYGGKTANYNISVTAVEISGIAVTAPTKTDYKVGESLDLTGGSLVATYNNGKEETLPLTAAGVSVTGFNSAAPAQNQKITVSYGGQNGTFNVNIAEKSYKVNFSNATVKNGETELKTGDSVAENTVLTVTAAAKDGYTATLKINGTAQSGTSATITVINDVTITVEYTKKSSGGSSGGSGGSSGGSSSSGSSSTTKNPTVDGKTQTWTDVASDISKLTDGTAKTINLNGGTTVPVDVVKAIATSNAEVTLEVDEVFSWTIDGSDIDPKDAKAADLSITKTTVTGTSALRGTVGTGFTIKGTNVKSELNINFKATHAGEFANLFKKVDGKLVFVDNVKVDKNGAAIGLEVSEKGEYVVMLGKYSDRAGDMDNDGISNAKDSLAILKDFLDMEKGVNPLVADVNGDGFINAKDALQVLIEYLGIK
ncbi:MAG: bacterial Ig-like domain-containing protein, partial [Oscillospiraceae bacterium]